MCGIVGAAASRPIAQLLLDGLKRLEYRGYDSAGMAVINKQNQLERLRVTGKVKELEGALIAQPLQAFVGIAHTRWATHGVPSEQNAHPLISNNNHFAVVHNGIIENHSVLREKLLAEGFQFHSETDTETAVHLIHYHYNKTHDLIPAIRAAVNELEGAYALGIFSIDYPDRVIGVRQGAPLVIGKGQQENFIASDPLALFPYTQQFIYLEDDDIVELTLDTIHIFNKEGRQVERETHALTLSPEAIERGEYRHYMKKEIMEQPKAIAECLEGRITQSHVLPAIFGPILETVLDKVEHIQLIACGTSYHAAMTAKYWFETLAEIPCSVEVASEFRYRHIAETKNSLFVTLSQSGETADTLAALRLAKKMAYLKTLVICNVPGSTMTREADAYFLTRAGVEIGVASTKAFVTQLTSLFLLVMTLRRRHHQKETLEKELISELEKLPAFINRVLQQDAAIAKWANAFTNKEHALFLGRGALYPIALEGALKMKEISYIHAEGYPAGELKHGPLALVDTNMPVVAMLTSDGLFEKTLSNLQEVNARGGNLFVLADRLHALEQLHLQEAQIITLPAIHPILAPVLYTIPLQLLAYHVAVLKGTDVDQPRNLAKSVTVE